MWYMGFDSARSIEHIDRSQEILYFSVDIPYYQQYHKRVDNVRTQVG